MRVGLDKGPPVALVTGKLLGLRVGGAAVVAECSGGARPGTPGS